MVGVSGSTRLFATSLVVLLAACGPGSRTPTAQSPPANGTSARTIFMVLRDGRLIFEGDQDRLEAATDPYITKFVKQRV